MKFISFRNKKVAYQSEGRGLTVVFLHGFGEDSRVWEDFTADLLEENYRVVVIDLPGQGKSETLEEMTVENMAEAVAAVVNKLQLELFVLIGHSMGGYVSLAFAEKYPQLLAGLSLFHSHPYADSDEKKANRQRSIEFVRDNGTVIFIKQLLPKLFSEKFANSKWFFIG